MERTYAYRFHGKPEEFSERVRMVHEQHSPSLSEYILTIDNTGQCRFGIERRGHSGGIWYIPTVCEQDEETVISGTLEHGDGYRGMDSKHAKSRLAKWFDWVDAALFLIILLPLWICLGIYCLFDWVRCRIRKIPKAPTTEKKLDYLMVSCLGCDRMNNQK